MSLDANTLQHRKYPCGDTEDHRAWSMLARDLAALIAARTAVAQYLPGVALQGFMPVTGLPAGVPSLPPASATKTCPMASDAPK